jgi:ubiquinone/menaquinone biosynthesis C-methylase UbiE
MTATMTEGSYTFDQFTPVSQNQEAARLQCQATLLLLIEQQIWQAAGLQRGMQVLDVGCGTGIISAEIAKQVSPGRVQGIDRSIALLEKASQSSREQRISNLSFVAGDVYDLPLLNETIDFVYGRLLFQHLTAPLRALSEIDRVLKPAGKICLVDVVDSWFTLSPEPAHFALFRQRMSDLQGAQGGDRQVGGKLGGYLAAAGFTNIETRVEVVSSDRIGGMGKFLELFSFGNPYLAIDPELESLVVATRQAVAELLLLPNAWAAFGLFVVTGNKPC